MSRSISLTEINQRIDELNSLDSNEERVKACNSLFVDVLIAGELYVIATPETTKEEWKSNLIRPYIAQAGQGDSFYLRMFSDRALAEKAAKRIDAVLDDGTIMVIKTTADDLTAIVRDYFMMGVDGVLLNDGEQWITYNCEAFLWAAYKQVLDQPLEYDSNFINSVKAVHDIAKSRVRIVVPVKYKEDIKQDDIFDGKTELVPMGDELLLLEYYDKYKVEEVFNEKVYWVDLSVEKLYSIIEIAEKVGIRNIKIAYRGKEGNGSPKNFVSLLDVLGVKKG